MAVPFIPLALPLNLPPPKSRKRQLLLYNPIHQRIHLNHKDKKEKIIPHNPSILSFQHLTFTPPPSFTHRPSTILKLLLLLEESSKADNSPVNQQPSNNGHDHGGVSDDAGMREQYRQSYFSLIVSMETPNLNFFAGCVFVSNRHTNTHDYQESGAESTQIQNRRPRALDEVVWVRAVAAYPVGHRRQHVGGYHEQRVVRLPEGAGQDDEEEADC